MSNGDISYPSKARLVDDRNVSSFSLVITQNFESPFLRGD